MGDQLMANKRRLINNDQLVREVSRASSISIAKTKSVFESLGSVLAGHLKEANEDGGVEVKILNGLSIKADFQPETTHNFLGKDIVVSQRIKPKAVLSRKYVERLNGK